VHPELPERFTYRVAIGYEPGVSRRDPSPVIRVGTVYHVWYTKATVDSSGYYGTVWHATSADGFAWTEGGEAIPAGPGGAWDGNGVFTPTTLVVDSTYYLFYTAVPRPFDNCGGGPEGTPTAIGVATSASPHGPWEKVVGNPILRPGPAPEVDSHRVDDACLIVREGKYWLYYKGRQKGLSPAETRMCLATAEAPAGPYVKSSLNPVIPSGHEVCVWPQESGVAAIVAPCGPEGSTVQFAPDGLCFERVADVSPPSAPGPLRTDNYVDGVGAGISWGLCQDTRSADRPFLLRFDCAAGAATSPDAGK